MRGVLVQVDATDEHRGVILGRAGHHDNAGASIDVALRLFFGQVHAGALKHVFDAKLAPRNEGRVTILVVGQDLDLLAVNPNEALLVIPLDLARPAAVNGVVFHEVRHLGSRMARCVNRHHVDIVGPHCSPERLGANAAEAIDANFNHRANLQSRRVLGENAKEFAHPLFLTLYREFIAFNVLQWSAVLECQSTLFVKGCKVFGVCSRKLDDYAFLSGERYCSMASNANILNAATHRSIL